MNLRGNITSIPNKRPTILVNIDPNFTLARPSSLSTFAAVSGYTTGIFGVVVGGSKIPQGVVFLLAVIYVAKIVLTIDGNIKGTTFIEKRAEKSQGLIKDLLFGVQVSESCWTVGVKSLTKFQAFTYY